MCFCPESQRLAQKAGWSEFLRDLEAKVLVAFAEQDLVQVILSDEILDKYPVEEYEDEYARRVGNVPYYHGLLFCAWDHAGATYVERDGEPLHGYRSRG